MSRRTSTGVSGGTSSSACKGDEEGPAAGVTLADTAEGTRRGLTTDFFFGLSTGA
jgi:hypothetical protein